jgi:hypothetical protein
MGVFGKQNFSMKFSEEVGSSWSIRLPLFLEGMGE